MQKIDFLQSDDTSVVVTPYTDKYAASLFELIDENKDYLSSLGMKVGKKYKTLDDVVDNFANPKNPDTEKYLMLSMGILAGSVSLSPVESQDGVLQVGYWLGDKFTGKGIACTSVELLTAKALERPTIEEVIAFTHPMNIRSQRTLDLAGFQFVEIVDNDFRKYSKQ